MRPLLSSSAKNLSINFLSSIIKSSCSNPNHLKQAHARIFTNGLPHESSLLSTITLSYISFGFLESADHVFRSIPNPSNYLYNMLIRSFATSGNFHQSFEIYNKLVLSGLSPDKFAFPFALKACAGLSNLDHGRQVHQQSISFGCSGDVYVEAALIDMYGKCGDFENARLVFDKMSTRDLVSWTSMISGYAHNGCSIETIGFFNFMLRSGVKVERVSLLSVLVACGRLGAHRMGESLHGLTISAGFSVHISVATALIDMYTKCGSLDLAQCMFDNAISKDVVCWSAMIASYGYHGLGQQAISLFNRMVEAGVRPNEATFLSILSACSHSGMLEEGERYFNSMTSEYGVVQNINHYGCMVDIFSRAGKLYEAWSLVKQMPVEPHSSMLGSLLGACRIHGDLDLAEKVADKIFERDPKHSGYYVLLSNIYAVKSRWNDVDRVRRLMVGEKVQKRRGISLIEFNEHIHEFGVGECSHPQWKEIYAYLEEVHARIKEVGYVPLVDYTLHDIEDETKEAALFHHSERLAIAFGLINMRPGVPIRITKNLRICGDCHNAIKIITTIVDRVIIVRDMNRFHHFENGKCSCRDYW